MQLLQCFVFVLILAGGSAAPGVTVGCQDYSSIQWNQELIAVDIEKRTYEDAEKTCKERGGQLKKDIPDELFYHVTYTNKKNFELNALWNGQAVSGSCLVKTLCVNNVAHCKASSCQEKYGSLCLIGSVSSCGKAVSFQWGDGYLTVDSSGLSYEDSVVSCAARGGQLKRNIPVALFDHVTYMTAIELKSVWDDKIDDQDPNDDQCLAYVVCEKDGAVCRPTSCMEKHGHICIMDGRQPLKLDQMDLYTRCKLEIMYGGEENVPQF